MLFSVTYCGNKGEINQLATSVPLPKNEVIGFAANSGCFDSFFFDALGISIGIFSKSGLSQSNISLS